MALDLSSISAFEYQAYVEKLPKEVRHQLTDDIWKSLSAGDARSATSWPLELQWFCHDRSMQDFVNAVFNDISAAPACNGSNHNKLKRALNVILTNLLC